jgi:transcriptional regulator GlxA family with amidase domain
MAEHISDQITLENLANVACLSTFHFARVFALSVGVPPYRYLSRIRLENAMAALAVGRLPISEIALRATTGVRLRVEELAIGKSICDFPRGQVCMGSS